MAQRNDPDISRFIEGKEQAFPNPHHLYRKATPFCAHTGSVGGQLSLNNNKKFPRHAVVFSLRSVTNGRFKPHHCDFPVPF